MVAEGVLLVGPYPPPHGGVSVHVAGVCRELGAAGVPCAVLNARRGAPPSNRYLEVSGAADLVGTIARHGRYGWLVHTHVNGHNHKSWLLALAAGIAGAGAPARILTLHSGMVGDYLAGGRPRSLLARLACGVHDRVICVNEPIRCAVAAAGVAPSRLEVLAAATPTREASAELPDHIAGWLDGRAPLLSATLAFEPEYRFDLLVAAIGALRADHPDIGCVVMGTGRDEWQARQQVQNAGLEDSFLLTGDVDHDVCLRAIAASALFVRCTDRDGDALSVREALSLGVPVVASEVGRRPAGTIPFAAGDFEGLLAAMRRALASGAAGGRTDADRARPPGDGAAPEMAELLALYRRTAGLRAPAPQRGTTSRKSAASTRTRRTGQTRPPRSGGAGTPARSKAGP